MVDFAKVREDYLTGMRTGDIAEKHRITVDTVREYVRRNNLASEKKAIQSHTTSKLMKKHELDVVTELAIINGRDLAISNRMRDLIAEKLNEDLDIPGLATLARTAKDVQHIGRIALDANSEAIRTELLSKKDLRDYSEEELLRLAQQMDITVED